MPDSLPQLISGMLLCLVLWVPAIRLLPRTRAERLVGWFFLAGGVGFGARIAAFYGQLRQINVLQASITRSRELWRKRASPIQVRLLTSRREHRAAGEQE